MLFFSFQPQLSYFHVTKKIEMLSAHQLCMTTKTFFKTMFCSMQQPPGGFRDNKIIEFSALKKESLKFCP